MREDKNFYKNFIKMASAIILQNIAVILVNVTDNLMIGKYSGVSLAGVTAVNQVHFLFQMILTGLGEGVIILGVRYSASKERDKFLSLSFTALKYAFLFMLIFFLVSLFCPEIVTSIFTSDKNIIREGTMYLKILKYSFPFFMMSFMMYSTLRADSIVGISAIISIGIFPLNFILNYIFIFGTDFIPAMGVEGAALASLIARISEFIFVAIYISRKWEMNFFDIHKKMETNKKIIKLMNLKFVRITAPLLLVKALWGLNNILQTVILGHISSSAIAASGIAATLFLFFKSIAIGTSETAAVIIGKTIGRREMAIAKRQAVSMQFIFIAAGIMAAFLLFIIKNPVLSLYNIDGKIYDMANKFIYIDCIVELFMSYQMPLNSGVIKAGGNTKYLMKMDLISIYLVVLPISFIAAFVFHACPTTVFLLLNSDQIFKGIPGFIMCNKGEWIVKDI